MLKAGFPTSVPDAASVVITVRDLPVLHGWRRSGDWFDSTLAILYTVAHKTFGVFMSLLHDYSYVLVFLLIGFIHRFKHKELLAMDVLLVLGICLLVGEEIW